MSEVTKKVAVIVVCMFATMSFANSQSITVKVTEQIAITKPFTTKVKTGEKCYEDTVEVMVNCGNEDTNSIGIDTLIGATLGVIVGNQIGGGSGRDAAKIVGGLGGGYIANQQRANKQCKTYNQVTRCEPVYEYITEERVVGYRNCAVYNGQKICKETVGPLETLTVTQTIVVH